MSHNVFSIVAIAALVSCSGPSQSGTAQNSSSPRSQDTRSLDDVSGSETSRPGADDSSATEETALNPVVAAAMTELRDGPAPLVLGRNRPGGPASVKYNTAMNQIQKLGQDAVPALIRGLADEQICKPAIQLLGDLQAIPAMPKLISLLSTEDDERDSLVLAALGKITRNPESGLYDRFYFRERLQKRAYRVYSDWYAAHGRKVGVDPATLPPPASYKESEPVLRTPPTRTPVELKLYQLAQTCKDDEFTQLIRTYIKDNGPVAAIPYLLCSFHRNCGMPPRLEQDVLIDMGAVAVPHLLAAAGPQSGGYPHHLAETFAQIDPAITLPPLIAALRDPGTPNRLALVEMIPMLEAKAGACVPVLRWLLEIDEAASLDLQGRAALALCSIGPAAAEAGPGIVQYLRDRDAPNESLPRRRQSPPPGRARPIAFPFFHLPFQDSLTSRLARLGPNAEDVLDYLIEEADSPINLEPFEAIAELGPAAARARPTLQSALKKLPAEARPTIYYALWRIGDPLDRCVAGISTSLKNEDDGKANALSVLARIGPVAVGAADDVLAAAKDRNRSVSSTALTTIARINPPAASAIPRLLELLKSDGDLEFRNDVVQCLGAYGPEARDAIPVIVKLLNDPKTVGNPRPMANGLLKLGTAPVSVIPDLIELLNHDDWVIVDTAAEMLGNAGPAAAAAAPVLRDLVAGRVHRDDLSNRRPDFAAALLMIQPTSTDDRRLSAGLLKDSDSYVRLRTAAVLGKFPDYTDDCVEVLLAGLSDEKCSVRELAARSLGELGPDAKATIGALKRVQAADERSVRIAATAALEGIAAAASK